MLLDKIAVPSPAIKIKDNLEQFKETEKIKSRISKANKRPVAYAIEHRDHYIRKNFNRMGHSMGQFSSKNISVNKSNATLLEGMCKTEEPKDTQSQPPQQISQNSPLEQ